MSANSNAAYLTADEVYAIQRDGLAQLGFRSEVVYIGTPVRRWSVAYHLDEDAGPTPPEMTLRALADTAAHALAEVGRLRAENAALRLAGGELIRTGRGLFAAPWKAAVNHWKAALNAPSLPESDPS